MLLDASERKSTPSIHGACSAGGCSPDSEAPPLNSRMFKVSGHGERDTLQFIDLLMGLFRGAVFHRGGVPKNCALAFMGRFPFLMGRFPS